jgi:hypothetical protein
LVKLAFIASSNTVVGSVEARTVNFWSSRRDITASFDAVAIAGHPTCMIND